MACACLISILVAPYDARDPNGRRDVKQPPPANPATDYLDSIGYHLMYRWQYRNQGGTESLVGACTVNVSGVNPVNNAAYQAGVRYFQLKKTAPGDPYALFDSTTFSPDANNPATGLNRWLPSAAVDNQGTNLLLGNGTGSGSARTNQWREPVGRLSILGDRSHRRLYFLDHKPIFERADRQPI